MHPVSLTVLEVGEPSWIRTGVKVQPHNRFLFTASGLYTLLLSRVCCA